MSISATAALFPAPKVEGPKPGAEKQQRFDEFSNVKPATLPPRKVPKKFPVKSFDQKVERG